MRKQTLIGMSKPQLEFSNLKCKYRLFKAGLGAGKTATMCINAIRAVQQFPDAVHPIFEPSYRLIEEVVKPEMGIWLDRFKIRYKFNGTWKTYELSEGRKILLKSQDDPDSVRGYQANAGSSIDELEMWPDLEKQQLLFTNISSRNRGRCPPWFVQQTSVYTTPDRGTNGLTYKLWGAIENLPPEEREAKMKEYQYVTATTESNIRNVGQSYIDNLKSLYSGKSRNVFLYGMWENLAEGIVYDEYDRIKCRSEETVQRGDATLYIGMDFNVGHMAAIVHVRRPNPDLTSKNVYQYHAVREFIDLSDTPEMIVMLKRAFPTQRLIIYPDCAGTSKKSNDASTSDITLLQQAGFWCRHHKSHPAVRDRVLSMNRALRKRELLVNDAACPVLARSLSEQAYDKKGEPSKSNNIDHPIDAQGYFCEYEMPIRRSVIGIGLSTG